jgi:hypothetical protein
MQCRRKLEGEGCRGELKVGRVPRRVEMKGERVPSKGEGCHGKEKVAVGNIKKEKGAEAR